MAGWRLACLARLLALLANDNIMCHAVQPAPARRSTLGPTIGCGASRRIASVPTFAVPPPAGRSRTSAKRRDIRNLSPGWISCSNSTPLGATETTDSSGEGRQINPLPTHYQLTILIPAYNERHRIGATLSTYMKYLSQANVYQHATNANATRDASSISEVTGSVSILVVDDGSTDGTAAYVREGSWLHPTASEIVTNQNCWNVDGAVKCISLAENSGKGAAIQKGMASLSPTYQGTGNHSSVRSIVLVADADGSGDISCIDRMLQCMENLLHSPAGKSTTLALVVGYREYPEAKKSPLRALLSWGFRTCVSLIFLGVDLGIQDTQCGFKLMTVPTGQALYSELNLRKWTHDVEMLYRAKVMGVPVGECSVPWVDKEGSKLVTKPSDAVFVSLVMLREIAWMRVNYWLNVWKLPSR